MVVVTNIATGSAYTLPADVKVSYRKQIAVTTMPMPFNDNPMLLNYGGATVSISISFVTMSMADISELIGYFASASTTQGYTINLTAEWNMTFTGFVSNLSVSQVAGEGQKWNVEVDFDVGTVV